MTVPRAAVVAALQDAQRSGFLGPGRVGEQIDKQPRRTRSAHGHSLHSADVPRQSATPALVASRPS